MRLLTTCLLLLLYNITFAQNEKTKKIKIKETPDTNFIVTYPQFISLGIYTASPLMQIIVDPVNNSYDRYKSNFKGNFSDLLGFTLSYRNIYIHYAFKTPFGPSEDSRKGRSASTGITLRVRKPRITLAAEYRRYEGYYDSNAYTYVPEDSLKNHYVRADMNYKNIGVNGIYNFSWRKFSYNAPLTFIERQLKSRIGFLVKAGANYTTIYSSDSTILSRAQTNNFDSFYGIRSIHALLFKAGPGIGVNIVVWKRFYFSMNYFIMGNFIEYQYNSVDKGNSIWYSNANLYTETATGFGYNSKRLFAGMSFNGDINIMRVKEASIKTNFASVSITVGYRFNSPHVFEKGWNKAAETVEDIAH
jgi:hypothetical protein